MKSESSRVTTVFHDGRGDQITFTRPVNKKNVIDVDWKKKWIPSEMKRTPAEEEEYEEYQKEFD